MGHKAAQSPAGREPGLQGNMAPYLLFLDDGTTAGKRRKQSRPAWPKHRAPDSTSGGPVLQSGYSIIGQVGENQKNRFAELCRLLSPSQPIR
jgi:hypothetical protein